MQKTTVNIKGEKLVVTKQDVQTAMKEYNCDFRLNQKDAGTRYAILDDDGKSYPPKRLLSLIVKRPRSFFNGGSFTNRVFRDLGFEIKSIRDKTGTIKSGRGVDLDAPVPGMKELVTTLFHRQWAVLVSPSSPKPDLSSIGDGKYAGVYVLAYGKQTLAGKRVKEENVIYVGMTHAGLRVRLKQFVDGIERHCCHSGAMTFYKSKKRGNGRPYSTIPLRKAFLVATVSVPCIVSKTQRSPRDLEKMGAVCELELYVLARIKSATGTEPELNTH